MDKTTPPGEAAKNSLLNVRKKTALELQDPNNKYAIERLVSASFDPLSGVITESYRKSRHKQLHIKKKRVPHKRKAA